MKRRIRRLALLLTLGCLTGCLAGCGGAGGTGTTAAQPAESGTAAATEPEETEAVRNKEEEKTMLEHEGKAIAIPDQRFDAADPEEYWISTLLGTRKKASVSSEQRYEGQLSLKLESDRTNPVARQSRKLDGVKEGYRYRLTAMVYTEDPACAPQIGVSFYTQDGISAGIFQTGSFTARLPETAERGKWQPLELTAVAPSAAVALAVTLENPAGAAGCCYFAGLELSEMPLIPNGDFRLGPAGWTGEGLTVSEERLTVPAGSCAVSERIPVFPDTCYFFSAEGNGSFCLQFLDEKGQLLDEAFGKRAAELRSPEEAAFLQILLPAEEKSEYAHLRLQASGRGLETVPDRKENRFSVQEGKEYVLTAEMQEGGVLYAFVQNYRLDPAGIFRELKAPGAGWQPVRMELGAVPIDPDTENRFLRIVAKEPEKVRALKLYAVTDSVANASFENAQPAPGMSLPFGWTAFGHAAVYAATDADQRTAGHRGLAVESFGLGEGGVRSSFVRGIAAGTSYELSLKARAARGEAKLRLEFYDESFGLLSAAEETLTGDGWRSYTLQADAPAGAAYAALSVTAAGEGDEMIYLDEAAFDETVRRIGLNPQLFVDDYLIAEQTGLTRSVHVGETSPTNLMPNRWIYGNCLYDEEEQLYKLWYQGTGKYTLWQSTSEDGVHWRQGVQCSYVKDGRSWTGMPASTTFKVREEDGSFTYKMICFNNYMGNSSNHKDAAYFLLTSEDGIHFAYKKTILSGFLDVITVAYDAAQDRYVCMCKQSLKETLHDGSAATKRTHHMMFSKDLEEWTVPVPMYSVSLLEDDGANLQNDCYGAGLYPLGDSYIGLGWRFRINELKMYGYVDPVLLFSRDLTEDWQRPFADTTMIDAGEPGTYCSYTAAYPTPMDTDGDGVYDELWWFYGIQNGNHGSPAIYRIEVAKWRYNGFVSLDSGKEEGSLTTGSFVLEGDELHVNAEIGGSLRAELLDENGAALPGFSLAESDALTAEASGTDVPLCWKGSASLETLRGRTLRLRLVMTETQLYALEAARKGE